MNTVVRRGMFAVTIDTLPGYRVRRVIGQVVGATARPRNTFLDEVKGLGGDPNPRASYALAQWREDAVTRMLEAAYRRGANAVVGMRFDHRDISDTWNEICAYGTAVFVVPSGTVPVDQP